MSLAMSHIPKRWVLPVWKLRHRGMSGHAQVILVPREGLGTQVTGHHGMRVVPRGAPVSSQARIVSAPQSGLPVIPPSSFT